MYVLGDVHPLCCRFWHYIEWWLPVLVLFSSDGDSAVEEYSRRDDLRRIQWDWNALFRDFVAPAMDSNGRNFAVVFAAGFFVGPILI